jgi:DNA invertase Pin-like site-specific DNA recombinase
VRRLCAESASEGWVLNPDACDDGRISGGTLRRPTVQRLLADIAAGKLDIVYKVDRLTRPLLDFFKLVEAFDKADVSFVSITHRSTSETTKPML